MPLHGQQECAVELERLGDAVGRAADDVKAVAERNRDRLMVMTRRGTVVGHDLGDQRVGCERHLVPPGSAGYSGLAVGRHSGIVGDVLVQRAAARDVQHLDAATDRERRDRADRGRLGHRAFEVVVGPIDAVRARVRGFAVTPRVDVGPAGENQRVDPRQECFGIARVVDDDRLAAGPQHGFHIAVGERGRAGVGPLVGATEPAPGERDHHHAILSPPSITIGRSCGAVPNRSPRG